MSVQSGFLRKLSPTHITGIGLLPGMRTQMLGQVALERGSIIAHGARERLVPLVHLQVLRVAALPPELLLADAARVGLVGRMIRLVRVQVLLLWKLGVAETARKRFLAAVRPQVADQVGFGREFSIAMGAGEGFLAGVDH